MRRAPLRTIEVFNEIFEPESLSCFLSSMFELLVNAAVKVKSLLRRSMKKINKKINIKENISINSIKFDEQLRRKPRENALSEARGLEIPADLLESTRKLVNSLNKSLRSKEIININHIKTLEEKSLQLKHTYLELQGSRQAFFEESQKLERKLEESERERTSFKEKNASIIAENELLLKDMRIIEKELF